MITELFEGIKKIWRSPNCDVINIERKGYVDRFITGTNFKFNTLNDFISDCKRAGIELEFKEGVFPK